jgi:hypothetical protein
MSYINPFCGNAQVGNSGRFFKDTSEKNETTTNPQRDSFGLRTTSNPSEVVVTAPHGMILKHELVRERSFAIE